MSVRQRYSFAAACLLLLRANLAAAQPYDCLYTFDGTVLAVVPPAMTHPHARVAASRCSGGGAVAISPDGSRVWVGGYQEVALVDTASNHVVDRIAVREGLIEQITFSPDGERAYLGVHDLALSSAFNRRAVIVVDTAGGNRLLKLEQASAPVVSHDGQLLYVFDEAEDQSTAKLGIKLLNARTGDLIAAIPGYSGIKLLLSPDDRVLYVASSEALTVVDTTTRAPTATIPIGGRLNDVMLSHDGSRCYVANALGSLQIITLPAGSALRTYGLNATPRRVALRADESAAFVSVEQVDSPSGITYARTKLVNFNDGGIDTIDVGGEIATAALPANCMAPSCEGDCDGDGQVQVDEIIRAIGLDLGVLSPCACAAFGDGSTPVEVDALLRGTDHALIGCPGPCTGSQCPDLVFEQGYAVYPIARGCDQPPEGEAGYVICTKNRGGGDAGAFQVRVGRDNLYTVDHLAAGGTYCTQAPFGSETFVEIDVTDQVQESAENNNTGYFSIAVLTATPSCTPRPTPTPPPMSQLRP